MSTNATDYLESSMGQHVLNGVVFPTPAVSGVVYVALFSGATTDALTSGGPGELEVDGSGGNAYARRSVTSGWTESPTGTFTNTMAVEFVAASGSWGTVSHMAVFDAASGGNALVHGPLSGSRPINTKDVAKFDAGDLIIRWD